MSTDTDGRFTRPTVTMDRLREQLATDHEDEPPPDVPRDQWERPLIVLPDGTDVLAYVRASKYGKLIEDYYALHRWDERNIVWGMSRGHHLVVSAAAVTGQSGKANVAALQDCAERAKIIAGADSGAITGTGLHKLSQRRDAQEDLSWLDPTTLACLDAYDALLAPFEILASETFVVCDDLRGAGSFDRVIRLLRPIVWPDGVIWPAGMILVIDVKTGKVTSMPYWGCDFTCQQLIYASGEPYLPGVTHLEDPTKRSARNVTGVTDQPGRNGRIGWDAIGVPGGPSQRWAMILHVPALTPWDAHWERVDLDVARDDAQAAQHAWERSRVKRPARFLALPNACLAPADGDAGDAGIGVPSGQYPVDTAVSIEDADAAKVATTEAKREQTTAALRQRIERATTREAIDALYDAWHASPAWTGELTDLCGTHYDALAAPTAARTCPACDHDRHQCPACGVNVPHGVIACPPCSLRIALDEAPTRDILETLWLAHGPDGDGLWAHEHSPVAQARYDALGPPDEGSTPDDEPVRYPLTVPPWPERGFPDEIILLCPECTLPVDHPESSDPITWCDCAGTIPHGERVHFPCRHRAHDPAQCPSLAGTVTMVFAGPDDDPAGPPPETDPVNPVATEDPPGPFDGTLSLADLRTAIDEALSVDTLNALYDAHGEGGDGIWDDECSARAQAAYDRLAPAEVPS